MGVGAAQNAAVEHTGRGDISAVGGLAGDLVAAVGAGKARADDLEIAVGSVGAVDGCVEVHR